MDSNSLNVTTGLVRAILILTEEQRRSSSVQSLCQYIYCKFSINDNDDDNNGTCYVKPAKLSSYDDIQEKDNLYFILIAKYIVFYIYPIFIFIGIFGNSLSCFIMFLNVRRNGYSANLYLTLLAFVDCLFLLGSALPEWISHIDYKLDIRLFSDLCCRLVYWFGHFTTHLSAGLVVSVTVERFIAVRYPLLASKINTVTHTHIALILLISFFILLDSRVLILVKHVNDSIHIVLTCGNDTNTQYERRDIIRCGVTGGNDEQAWVFIDSAVYTLIPFIIIVTLNSLIIHRLIHAQRSRQRMFHSNNQSSKYEDENLRRNMSEGQQMVTTKHKYLRRCQSVPGKPALRTLLHLHTSESRSRSSIKQSEVSTEFSLEIKIRSDCKYESSLIRHTTNKNNTRLTVLLLFVSFSFLVLTLPAVVLNLIVTTKIKPKSSHFIIYSSPINRSLDSDRYFYFAITRLLMIINHSVNFILYFVVGKRFRRDLKKLFICF